MLLEIINQWLWRLTLDLLHLLLANAGSMVMAQPLVLMEQTQLSILFTYLPLEQLQALW
jgi:hypothetical protein